METSKWMFKGRKATDTVEHNTNVLLCDLRCDVNPVQRDYLKTNYVRSAYINILYNIPRR